MTSSISLITPVLNEAERISSFLQQFRGQEILEHILVDGGSSDQTRELIRDHHVRLLRGRPGRGTQQNAGAAVARGEILIFVHCDTFLPSDFVSRVTATLAEADTIAGAFSLAIDATGFWPRVIEHGANLRSRLLELPYGDQALFMRRKDFEAVGGFPNQPFLEDIGLVRRLKRHGRIRLAGAPVITSARRWRRHGFLRATLLNQLILAGYLLNVPPDTLARWYYGNKLNP